jgi:hypothetical protein
LGGLIIGVDVFVFVFVPLGGEDAGFGRLHKFEGGVEEVCGCRAVFVSSVDLGGGYLFEIKGVVVKDIAAVRGSVFGSKVDWRGLLRSNCSGKAVNGVQGQERGVYGGANLGVDWFIVARDEGRSFERIAEMVFSTSQR